MNDGKRVRRMSDLIKREDVLKELQLDHKDVIYIDKTECARRIKAIPSADRPNKTKAEMIAVMEEYRDKQLLMSDYWYGINWAINTIRTADISDEPSGE